MTQMWSGRAADSERGLAGLQAEGAGVRQDPVPEARGVRPKGWQV